MESSADILTLYDEEDIFTSCFVLVLLFSFCPSYIATCLVFIIVFLIRNIVKKFLQNLVSFLLSILPEILT